MDIQPRLTNEDKRTLGLSSLGGALEFYDFVIYVFYAKIISELFFPSTLSPFWAMLNTYGIFATGVFFPPARRCGHGAFWRLDWPQALIQPVYFAYGNADLNDWGDADL